MDIEQASEFLVASVLTGLGFVALTCAIVVVNNLLSKYWKPVNFGYFVPKALFDAMNEPPARFAEPHEIRPSSQHVDKSEEPKLDLSKNR